MRTNWKREAAKIVQAYYEKHAEMPKAATVRDVLLVKGCPADRASGYAACAVVDAKLEKETF